MDWKILEDIKRKRKDTAAKEMKERLSAYQKSEQDVSEQEAIHTQLLSSLQQISQSPFSENVPLSKEALNNWQQQVAAAKNKVNESANTIVKLKKNSQEHFSQWESAQSCYQSAHKKYEKCVEIRKEDDKHQFQLELLEADKQLDEFLPKQGKNNI